MVYFKRPSPGAYRHGDRFDKYWRMMGDVTRCCARLPAIVVDVTAIGAICPPKSSRQLGKNVGYA
jgi:hypothetical protein